MSTPMTASALLAALKAEGLEVVEYKEWRTHERDAATGKAFGPVHGVVMHHTASGTSGILDYCYDGSAALPGPLCQGLIDKSGVVYLLSKGRSNHAGGGDPDVKAAVIAESYGDYPPATNEHEGSSGAVDGNDCFYGFECVNKGDGTDPWPAAQVNAMVKAGAAICRYYGWSAKSVIAHKEWSDWKNDPYGFDMKNFRSEVQALLDGTPTPVEAPKPTPSYAPYPGTTFFKIGKKHALVKAMGKRLVAEGYKGYKVGPSEEFTRADIKAYAWWQKKLGYTGAAADGYPGAKSWKALKVPKS